MHVAIDLGAGSGRVFLGRLGGDDLELIEVHRFDYAPRLSAGHLRWAMARLLDGLSTGLRAASVAARAAGDELATVGVDSWGVDYGLVDATGRLLEDPICYRDDRTTAAMASVMSRISAEDLFARTGAQILPINTLYQLAAHVQEGLPPSASRLLMIPDVCHHHLTGIATGEYTNATTTQLLDPRSRRWDDGLFEALDLPRHLMPELVEAGTVLGPLLGIHRESLNLPPMHVVVPGTHDTASAVAGTPLADGWAFVSSGTWSLVGVEIDTPLVSPAVAAANCTNEGGVFGTIRFLKNVMGLWLLDACRREWSDAWTHPALVEHVSARDAFAGVIDPDDLALLNPRSMPAAIHDRLRHTGQQPPDDEVGLAKVIFDSLALRYAEVVETIESLIGRTIRGIHIVGGGSRNDYLNQATADASGRPVVAGPVEATVAGNVIVQAIACGEIATLAEGRARVARSCALRRFEPGRAERWVERRKRYAEVVGRRVRHSG
jgi:rhamnulokinase